MAAIQPTKNTGLIVDEFLRYANEHLSTITGVIYTTSNYPPLGQPGPGIIQWQGYSVQGFKESTIFDEQLYQEVEIENIIIDEEFIEQGLPLDISVVDPTNNGETDAEVLLEAKFGGIESEIPPPEEYSEEDVAQFVELADSDSITDASIENTSIEPRDPNDKALNDPNYKPPVSNKSANNKASSLNILNGGGGGGPAPNIIIDSKKLKEKFMVQTCRVIRELEGGYYHPNMKAANPQKYKCMGKSGETMYGIDRVAGAPSTTDPLPARQFWALIDSQDASKTWPHLHIPQAPIRDKLIYLAAQVMEPLFNSFLTQYIPDPNLRKIVNSYDALLFHFIYASWNGPQWFQGWGGILSAAYAQGITDPDKLARLMIAKRLDNTYVLSKKQKINNALIAQGGGKIAKLFGYAKG